MKIDELEENTQVNNLTGTIIEVSDANETGNGTPFQEAILEDDTGKVRIVFWDDQVAKYTVGQSIVLIKGWCKVYNSELQVTSGKFGEIKLVSSGEDE